VAKKSSPNPDEGRIEQAGEARGTAAHMPSEQNGNRKKTKFHLKPVPYARISRAISESDDRGVDPKELAEEIRAHGVTRMPPEVVDFLCRFLAGEIETRGRKPAMTKTERRNLGLRAAGMYKALRRAQLNDPEALEAAKEIYEEFKNAVGDSYSPSENIWMIVSVLFHGHPGHHKYLSNLASEVAPASLRSDRSATSRE
jgi:proteasome lid subunit RPN8/RPN11